MNLKKSKKSVFNGFFHKFFLDFFHESQKQAYFEVKYVSYYDTYDFFSALYERELNLNFSKHP